MPVSGFDIASLLEFRAAHLLCEKCFALLVESPYDLATRRAVCPVCKVSYEPSETYGFYAVGKYLADKGYKVGFRDVLAHSQALARIATRARYFLNNPGEPGAATIGVLPMGALLESLLAAQQFVHFTSFGIHPLLIGALKLAAQRIPVRGIVSNAKPADKEELITYKEEAPKLDVKLFERSDNPADWKVAPHQKVIVIDGLLAFKGAANLTTDGWRKAAKGLDAIELETNVDEVIRYHNLYFSPVWGSLSGIGSSITMLDDIPF